MDYSALASQEALAKAIAALKTNNFEPIILESGAAALEKIKELVPKGVSIMNGSSRTLEQIGFVDYLKSGTHGWNNLHEGVLAEKDPARQADLRKHAVVSDYYFGSVHALTEEGQLMVASNTGSQLPHLVFTSPNLVLVVGTQKLVPTMADGLDRIATHVLPLEEENMQQKYGAHTFWGKTVILNKENPTSSRSIKVLLVKEKLGF